VEVTETGASVDTLMISLFEFEGLELGFSTVLRVGLGHAEVSAGSCADAPECADTQDNDGDGVLYANDPGCRNPDGTYDPNDDDEPNECSDTIDNTDPEDTAADASDPGCHANGVFDPQDDDETDEGGTLARTGTNRALPLAGSAVLLAVTFALLAVRRRTGT